MTTAVMEAPAKTGKAKAIKLPLALLRDSLTKISPAFSGATTIPVLGMVKIEALDGAMAFTATDLDMAMRVTTEGEGGGAAAFLVPSQRFLNYAKMLDGVEVSLSPGASRVTLKCGRATTQFPTMSGANFPATKFGVQLGVSVKQATLAEMLRFTMFAVSEEASKYTLGGALLEAGIGFIRMVATDGHRLAMFTVKYEDGAFEPVILPLSFMHGVAKVLAEGAEEPARIGGLDESVACDVPLEKGSVAITHRKIAGGFPNYKAVIPSGNMAATMTINVEDMLASLSRCVAMSDKQTVCVKITFSSTSVSMKAVDPEAGETEEVIELAGARSVFDPFTTGFKGTYLVDALKRIDGDECLFEFAQTDGRSPLKVSYTTDAGGEFTYVVMPMRV